MRLLPPFFFFEIPLTKRGCDRLYRPLPDPRPQIRQREAPPDLSSAAGRAEGREDSECRRFQLVSTSIRVLVCKVVLIGVRWDSGVNHLQEIEAEGLPVPAVNQIEVGVPTYS